MRADARRNRALILEAAEEAFARDGLGVPVDEIARRAGVGAGTLYRHFPTKEALFEAIVVEHMGRLAAEARELVEGGSDTALFDFIARLFEEAMTKRNLIEALEGAGVDLKAHRAAGEKADIDQSFQIMLDRAQLAGQVRPDVKLGDLFGLVMGACTFAGHPDCSQTGMLAVVCDGLRPQSAVQ